MSSSVRFASGSIQDQRLSSGEGNQVREEKFSLSRLLSRIDETFVDLIPSIEVKEMAPLYRYSFGALLVVLQLFIFVYLFATGVLTGQSNSFLVPSKYYDDSRCAQITRSATGTYYVSRDGVWSTAIGANMAAMSYLFEMNQYTVSSSEMYQQFLILQQSLVSVGSIALNSTLSENLLIWSSIRLVAPDKRTMFSMTGDIKVILKQQYFDVYIGSNAGLCNATSTSEFSPSTGRFAISYSYSDFMANDLCRNAIPPSTASNMTYNSFLSGDKLTFEIDTQAIVTALFVNIYQLNVMGTSSDGSLQIGGLSRIGKGTNGVYYFVDPHYPGMSAIVCASISGNPKQIIICGIQVGHSFGFPFFIDQGLSSFGGSPSPCKCNSNGQGGLDVNSFADYLTCNSFRFFTGIMIYNEDLLSGTSLVKFINLYTSAQYANRAFLDAAFYTSRYGSYAEASTSTYEKAFSFCDININCTIINLSVYPGLYHQNAVSEDYYQLSDGACNDTFSFTISALNEMVNMPYGTLTESYVECVDAMPTILSNTLGITIGNVGAYTPMMVITLIILLQSYQMLSGKQLFGTFSKGDREDALDAFATALLLVRDEKLVPSRDAPDKPPPPLDSLKMIVNEMESSVKYNPDSQRLRVSEFAEKVAAAAKVKARCVEMSNPLHRRYIDKRILQLNNDIEPPVPGPVVRISGESVASNDV